MNANDLRETSEELAILLDNDAQLLNLTLTELFRLNKVNVRLVEQDLNQWFKDNDETKNLSENPLINALKNYNAS